MKPQTARPLDVAAVKTTGVAPTEEEQFSVDAWDKYTIVRRRVRELTSITGDDKLLYGILAHVEAYQRSFTVDEFAAKIGADRKTVLRSIKRLQAAHMIAKPDRVGRRSAYTYKTTPDHPEFGIRDAVDGRTAANRENGLRAQKARQEARLDRLSADSLILFTPTKSRIETSTPAQLTSESGTTTDPKIGPQTAEKVGSQSPIVGPHESHNGTTTLDSVNCSYTLETSDCLMTDDGFDTNRKADLIALGCDPKLIDEHYKRFICAIAQKKGVDTVEARRVLDTLMTHPLVTKGDKPYGVLYVGIVGRGKTPAHLLDEPGEAQWRQTVPGIRDAVMRAAQDEASGTKVDWTKLATVLEVPPAVLNYARRLAQAPASAHRSASDNSSVPSNANASVIFSRPDVDHRPSNRETLIDAVQRGTVIDDRWLRGGDIPLAALEIARKHAAEEAPRKSATPLCDELAVRDPTEYRRRLEEAFASVEIPSNLGLRRSLDHPMLLGMCRTRLERELGGDR